MALSRDAMRRRALASIQQASRGFGDALRRGGAPPPPPKAAADRGVDLTAVLPEQLGPVLLTLGSIVAAVTPAVTTAVAVGRNAWVAAAPYHPEELLPAAGGLALIFFGGTYVTLVAAVEAAARFGWPQIAASGKALWDAAAAAVAAVRRDAALDADRDGVADVDELTPAARSARVVAVVARSVDPAEVAAAAEGLATAGLAVVATLRLRFAKALTLGGCLADMVEDLFGPFLTAAAARVLPPVYHQWAPVVTRLACRSVGVWAAWWLARAVSAGYAAARGGHLLVGGLTAYAVRHGYMERGWMERGSLLAVGVWGALVVLGAGWQLINGFKLPFPLNLLLLPVSVVEALLVFVVGVLG
ncbi:hypothetical protein MMPV_000582 [Pyropia vietnamensis]